MGDDGPFDWIRGHIHGEIAAVTGAPMLFGAAVVIVAAIIFFGLRAHFGQQIKALEATLGQKQSLIDEYTTKLGHGTPLEVAARIIQLESTVSDLTSKVNKPYRRLAEWQINALRSGIEAEERLKGYWIMMSTTPDTESTRYGRQIVKILDGAHMQCQYNHTGTHDEGESGIIFYAPDAYQDEAFSALLEIFRSSGLPATRKPDPENPGTIYIFIAPEEDV